MPSAKINGFHIEIRKKGIDAHRNYIDKLVGTFQYWGIP